MTRGERLKLFLIQTPPSKCSGRIVTTLQPSQHVSFMNGHTNPSYASLLHGRGIESSQWPAKIFFAEDSGRLSLVGLELRVGTNRTKARSRKEIETVTIQLNDYYLWYLDGTENASK